MDAVIEFIQSNVYAHFAFVGLITGILARILMPGKDPMGLIKTTLLGITGSLLSVYLVKTYSISIPVPAPWSSYAASLMGALLILSVFKIIRNIG
jgi:uncharacterized membrane protein YeaQ/YmgE (transglycosylase-associated protein family)